MWTCSNCGEALEGDFDICWKCGTSKVGIQDPQFTSELNAGATNAEATGDIDPISCAHCNRALRYVGRKRFHEGTRWGALGEIGELFVKREHFDVYVCPRCGRVEIFVDGIGEQYRPH